MRVAAVARSSVKGVPKDPVERARLVREWGVEGDAHAGPGPRQVSVLALGSIRAMEERFGAALGFGRFGENVVVDDALDREASGGRWADQVEVGDLVGLGRAVVEVTALGKECHKGCAIRVKTGDCIMPREGVFGRVVAGGEVTAGDPVRVVRPGQDLAVAVLAGGRATRFGSDKRFTRRPDGRTLLQAAVETGRGVLASTSDGRGRLPLVSVGCREGGIEVPGARVVPDEVEEAGPLAGVVACLRRAEAPLVVLFAVDQPGVTGDLLRALAVRCEGPGLCLRWQGRVHPLPCVLRRSETLAALERALGSEDRSLHRAWQEAGVQALEASDFADLGDPADLLCNWNRPEDAARASPGRARP